VDVGRYSKFLTDIGRYFRSVADVGGYLILVEFSRILGSVQSSGFFTIDIGGNLRLVDFSGFLGFLFGVRTANYKTFLFAMGGDK